MGLKITDYFSEDAGRGRIDYSNLLSNKKRLNKYLNQNLGADTLKLRAMEAREGLRSYTKPIEYKTGNRQVDANQLLDFGTFNSRLDSFMSERKVPMANQMRAPTQEELDRVIWEDG